MSKPGLLYSMSPSSLKKLVTANLIPNEKRSERLKKLHIMSFFISEYTVLENSHNLLTTIKANVLAIYNPKHCRKRKKVKYVCVRAASSQSLLCVSNGKHFWDKKHNFCVLTMELSMNHKAIQSLSIQIFHSTLYISCLFINKQRSAI